ncbi:MAG: hypothetical protein GEU80_13245 [Dehalococcoidia bacterium]|nr:hypothetical protein [Dehalococcoidia bacterium]
METAALSALAAIGVAIALFNMLARRFRVPTVLMYLTWGALAGPSVLGLVDPEELGESFAIALEVLVALIVFEGAFSIDVPYLRRVGSVVRNLLSVGLVVTFLAGTLLAGALDVLPWRTAFLFGALVTVTGPTVIIPLVRQVRLNDRVRAVLLGEGVLIDPLGAILAVVVLEAVLSGLETEPVLWVPSRLLGGAAIALAAAGLVWLVLRLNRRPSSSDTTLMLLGVAVATFGVAERLLPGAGLTAMATLGVVLAAMHIPNVEDVRSFEDDLSRMLIGAVYILAAATVDLELLLDLWPMGFLVVFGLMVLVRPAVVWISSFRSDLSWRERAYIGMIGPRGVVAASLAAFAGEALGPELGGPTLTALVFLVVIVTVAVQNTYAEFMARWLEVKAMRAVIAGAGSVARDIAVRLAAGGFDVTVADIDQESVERARAAGLEVEHGDVTDLKFLERIHANDVQLAVGATNSDQANLMFCRYVRSANTEAEVFARVMQQGAVEAFRDAGVHSVSQNEAVSNAMMEMIGSPVLHEALSTDQTGRMTVEVLVGSGLAGRMLRDLRLPHNVLVLLIKRGDQEIVPHGDTVLLRDDRMLLFGTAEQVTQARERLVSVE